MKEKEINRAKSLTLKALPTFCVLPTVAVASDTLGLFASECSIFHVLLYFFLVEFCVFIDHYYILHKFKIHSHGIHNIHHSFRTIDSWAAFAFHPLDGLSQGLPVVYVAYAVPVPAVVVYFFIIFVGVWTIFIHTKTGINIPLLLCYDHHSVHHRLNWFNFGFVTQFWDWCFGTLKAR